MIFRKKGEEVPVEARENTSSVSNVLYISKLYSDGAIRDNITVNLSDDACVDKTPEIGDIASFLSRYSKDNIIITFTTMRNVTQRIEIRPKKETTREG